MHKKYFLPLLAAISILTSAFVYNNREFEISKNLEIFANLYREINTHYVDDIDPSTIMKTGIDAMVKSLDPYTNYWSESQMERFRYLTTGKYEGIGAVVKKIGDYPTIVESFEGSLALGAGLKIADEIWEINGQSAEGKTRSQLRTILRGVPGTSLMMKVKRPGQKDLIDIQLVRGVVNVPNVPYSGMLDDNVGYINLTTFTRGASKNITKSLRDLYTEDPDIKGIVLDLRDNGGGFLNEAINICNIFLTKGTEVVNTRSKVKSRDKSYKTQNEPVDLDLPVVVLINKSSASASEIVSGVLQDLDRGVLIGQQSFGKGLVQNTYDIGYNSKVKITISKYYIPSGRCIQSVKYKDGEPVQIHDEKRASFKTKNGRKVLDGGGVRPDIVLDDIRDTKLIKDLIKGNYIFNYVTKYTSQLDEDPVPGELNFTDYDKFVSFLGNENFEYQTNSEEILDKFRLKAEEEGSLKVLNNELANLEKAINDTKAKELQSQRETITSIIEEEIINRYHFEKGKVIQSLKKDVEVKRAVDLLNSDKEYKGLLTPS